MTAAFVGVWAAALTPLDAQLAPDHAATVAHCRWLLREGCDGIAVLGTTGEANSFSVRERRALIEALGAAGLPMARILVGTGCCAVPDTVELTEAALAAGAAGALMLPPFYYKGVSEDGLFQSYAAAIERVGDSRLKLLVYDFPKMTGVPVSVDLLERLHRAYPETVVGVKDSSGDLEKMLECCRRLPGFAVFAGSERFLLPLLQAGGAGCISATTNVTAPAAAALYRDWQGPKAAAWQQSVTALRAALEALPLTAGLKALLARQTGRPAWSRVRPPLDALDPAAPEIADLAEALTGAGIRLAA